MSSTRAVTAEEFSRMGEGKRELVRGEVVELTPPGQRHGEIQAQIAYLLKAHILEAGRREVVAVESGYRLTSAPDSVRAPDVAVIAADRAALHRDVVGYLPFAPDLAVEVVSPSDSFVDVEAKARMWLEHGSRVVWVVEPDSRRVLVYEPDRDRRDLDASMNLEGGEVLPGFRVPVSKLF